MLEVALASKRVLRQWGGPEGQFERPAYAERLPGGNLLVADQGHDRVVELDGEGRTVWQYGQPGAATFLSGPASACRLPSGATLIADAGNRRVVEVDRDGSVGFSYGVGPATGPGGLRAVRLRNGHTLISDPGNNRILELDAGQRTVRTYATDLRTPSDAKVVADFTGLTWPFGP